LQRENQPTLAGSAASNSSRGRLTAGGVEFQQDASRLVFHLELEARLPRDVLDELGVELEQQQFVFAGFEYLHPATILAVARKASRQDTRAIVEVSCLPVRRLSFSTSMEPCSAVPARIIAKC
jgi:hypothetical protein